MGFVCQIVIKDLEYHSYRCFSEFCDFKHCLFMKSPYLSICVPDMCTSGSVLSISSSFLLLVLSTILIWQRANGDAPHHQF